MSKPGQEVFNPFQFKERREKRISIPLERHLIAREREREKERP